MALLHGMVGGVGMYLLSLLKANLRHKKGSFISVLILSMIIALAASTIISINTNIETRSDEAMDRIPMGELLVIANKRYVTDERVERIKGCSNVSDVSIVETVTQNLKFGDKRNGNFTSFLSCDPEKFPYRVYKDNEREFEPDQAELKKGEVYLPISFKQEFNCKVGDTFVMPNGTNDETFTIKAFIEEPYLGSQTIGIKLAVMNKEDFSRLQKGIDIESKDDSYVKSLSFVCISKNKDTQVTNSEFKKEINQASAIVDYGMITMFRSQCHYYTLIFTDILSAIMYVFLFLLAIVVLIVIGHSITSSIEMDYVNLGILKAMGFTKGMLQIVFVLEYMIAEVIGCLIGILLSKGAIYFLNQIFVLSTGLLSEAKIDLVSVLLLLLVVLVLSVAFIVFKTRKIAKITPICAIRGGSDEVFFHSRAEVGVGKRGLNLKIALRQITSNKRQYVSCFLITAVLVFFLVSITAINTSMDSELVETSFGGVFTDVTISYEKTPDELLDQRKAEVDKMVKQVAEVSNSFETVSSYFTLNEEEYHGTAYSDMTVLKSVLKGRLPKYDNEILVTPILADEMNLKVGDTVSLTYKEKSADYVISGFYQETSDLGRCFSFSVDAMRRIVEDKKVKWTEYVLKEKAKSKEVTKMLQSEYGEELTVTDNNSTEGFTDTIVTAMHLLNNVIYVVAILFALIVVVLLCGKAFYREQTDIGIYKAVGFSTRALRLQFALRFMLVAVFGSILGIVLNLFLNNMLMQAIFINIGVANYQTVYTVTSLVLPVVTIGICFFVFAYLVARKVKRVDTRTLITE